MQILKKESLKYLKRDLPQLEKDLDNGEIKYTIHSI